MEKTRTFDKVKFSNMFIDAIMKIRNRLYIYEEKLDDGTLKVSEVFPLYTDLEQLSSYISIFQGMEISNMEGEQAQLIRVLEKLKIATTDLKGIL